MAGQGALALGHYNTQQEAGFPAPWTVNNQTEVHLDFKVNSDRSAQVSVNVPFIPIPGQRSIVIHTDATPRQEVLGSPGLPAALDIESLATLAGRPTDRQPVSYQPYYPDWVERMWIDLEGLANLRDVGGIPTSDGDKIIPGRLLRSDNLQALTASDVDQLLGLGLTDVIDLRSDYEAEQEGPGPLSAQMFGSTSSRSFGSGSSGSARPSPTYAPRCCLRRPCRGSTSNPASSWTIEVASVYFSYLVDRPDSVLAALRTVAGAPGVALVHCAAGKDRTGIVALALSVADAERQAIIDDYAASSERVEQVVARLMASRPMPGTSRAGRFPHTSATPRP